MIVFLTACAPMITPPVSRKITYQEAKDLTVKNVAQKIQDNIGSFQRCHQRSMKKRKNRKVAGKVTLVFLLLESGDLQRIGVMESELPLDLKACAIEALWSIKFDPPLTGRKLKINQPISFNQ